MTSQQQTRKRIAIAGAGSIGCFVGGCLLQAGRDVRLLVRPAVAERLASGLVVTGLDGQTASFAGQELRVATDPAAAFADAEVILVTVKSLGTGEIAAQIARHASAQAVVVSLQNGVTNARTLADVLGPDRDVRRGMVPFNVVQQGEAGGGPVHVRRTTSGTILIERRRSGPSLEALLSVAGAEARERDDMAAVQWGKLLFNLNNALNALSGLPLAAELSQRAWRTLLADQIAEALDALRAARIRVVGTEGIPPAAVPHLLRLPDWLFTRIARRMLAIDPAARSSMWEDLARGRPTEIDFLQGEVLRLADAHGLTVPLTRKVVAAIRAAEVAGRGSPGLDPDALRVV